MWIVQLALRQQYTFVVMALLILVLGVTAMTQMRTDIFRRTPAPGGRRAQAAHRRGPDAGADPSFQRQCWISQDGSALRRRSTPAAVTPVLLSLSVRRSLSPWRASIPRSVTWVVPRFKSCSVRHCAR